MDISESIEIMKSLADTSRLRVLNSLMGKPQYVEELAQRLDLAVSTVSFHLKKLEKAKLVYKVKEQYYIIYHVCDKIFNMSLRELTNFENLDKFIQNERINKYRQKVLKTFFRKEKLEKLPVQWKKKMIVLDEFVKKFKQGKRYKEEEVNEIIMESYFDYCTIRRLMIDEGIMRRENQNYWLTSKPENSK
ncbi:MAG: metalloregulator ArsR/SmtB family transcription factor [Ignavibacteriaceae bacterium]|nr:metalloregulator ArsR/SmtB family transcription factor [Ignavibacteriaceae bacterium]